MNKEKQIEIQNMIEIVEKVFSSDYSGDYESGIRDFATRLIQNNVKILPEDSVVLTREEYENMQFVAELIGTKQKIGACDFNRVVLQRTKQARKETAREFAEKLNTLIDNNENFNRGVFGWGTEEIKILIKELAKQYEVNIGEENV